MRVFAYYQNHNIESSWEIDMIKKDFTEDYMLIKGEKHFYEFNWI